MSQFEQYTQIIGSEMEWAVSIKAEGEKGLRQLDFLDEVGNIGMFCNEYLHDGLIRVSASMSGNSGMMSNGSRYYQDVGGHIEYATPENTTSNGLLLSELAGERIVSESLRKFVKNRDNLEYGVIRKRVIDDNMTLWGYHINISEHRRSFINFEESVKPLLMHYASSLPLFGAGAITKSVNHNSEEEITYRYSHGQKVTGLTNDFAHGTTNGTKPIINLRDEPHASYPENRRIHIVGNDPHVSPWASRMAIGSYSLLLIACRQKKLPLIEPEGGYVYRMARQAAYDVDVSKIYQVSVDGQQKKYKANDIQKIYLEYMNQVSDLTSDQEQDLYEWNRAVADFDADPMSLRNRSDSIAKLALIRAKLERSNRASNDFDNESANIDKEYTTIMRVTKERSSKDNTPTLMDKTVAGKLRKSWFNEYMPSDQLINDAVMNPPTTTRAYTRGRAILMQPVTSADWTSYKVGESITTLEPLQGTKRQQL